MNPINQSAGNSNSRKTYIASSGKQSWLVDAAELIAVTPTGPIAALPWMPAGMLGVISSDRGPLSLMSAGHPDHLDGHDAQAAMTAVLKTSKGLIGFQIDSIQQYAPGMLNTVVDQPDPLATTPLARVPALLDHLIGSTQSFGVAQPGSSAWVHARRDPQAAQDGIGRESFLLVHSGQVSRAIAAKRVIRIGKHQGAHPVDAASRRDWVVQLDGELLPARSLGRMEHASMDESEAMVCAT